MVKTNYWVLFDVQHQAYYVEYGLFGPRCSSNLEEAFVFLTERAAKLDPAYSFPLMAFEPKRVDFDL